MRQLWIVFLLAAQSIIAVDWMVPPRILRQQETAIAVAFLPQKTPLQVQSQNEFVDGGSALMDWVIRQRDYMPAYHESIPTPENTVSPTNQNNNQPKKVVLAHASAVAKAKADRSSGNWRSTKKTTGQANAAAAAVLRKQQIKQLYTNFCSQLDNKTIDTKNYQIIDKRVRALKATLDHPGQIQERSIKFSAQEQAELLKSGVPAAALTSLRGNAAQAELHEEYGSVFEQWAQKNSRLPNKYPPSKQHRFLLPAYNQLFLKNQSLPPLFLGHYQRLAPNSCSKCLRCPNSNGRQLLPDTANQFLKQMAFVLRIHSI